MSPALIVYLCEACCDHCVDAARPASDAGLPPQHFWSCREKARISAELASGPRAPTKRGLKSGRSGCVSKRPQQAVHGAAQYGIDVRIAVAGKRLSEIEDIRALEMHEHVLAAQLRLLAASHVE